jgi:hypothetical protein
MTPGEKLAREICWARFFGRPQGITKAQYWKSMPESTRKNYECDAAQFVFVLGRLSPDMLTLAHQLANRPTPNTARG